MPTIPRICAAVLAAALSSITLAQLTVSPQTDLQQLARTITGPGVTISNPNVNCHPQGFGKFQYAGSLLGIDEGILLTTGSISNAVGPNNAENKTLQQNRSGNSILNTVTGRTTYDACLFEFDVIPAGDSLRFDFVFASEEYNEWVGSQYNDVFGFFISGPGITGDPGIGNDRNIALIPGTNQAVAINNVNNGSNHAFHYDNAGGQHIQYDGFTKGLSAFSPVQPCQTYHLKLVVADASDKKLDSGVFIAKVKSNPVTMQLLSANGGDTLIEGCNNGLVRFTRQMVNDQPLTLEYYLHGTALNGVDYAAIGNPDADAPKTITIPANQASADQPISLVADGTAEGPETMLFILGNPYCPGSRADTLVVPITDSLHVTLAPASSNICKGGQVQLAASGGTHYLWSPAAGLSSTSAANPVAQPVATTTYAVSISDGDCARTLHAQVKVSDPATSATITKPLCNGASNGAINLSVSNGIPPYAFQWSGPNGFSATTEDIANIPAGTYSVTVTDAACTRTASFNVGQPAALGVSLAPSILTFGQNISCHGGHDGSINTTITGGSGPYTVAWEGPDGFTSHAVHLTDLGVGTYAVTITDVNGCTATANTTLLASGPMMAEITSATNVQCVGDGAGAATAHVTGGMPLYTYSWNTVPAQSGATATALLPGTYTVTATDQYGCTVQTTASISGPTVPLGTQLDAKADVTCHGAGNGGATISVSGGTPGYSVAWNTVPAQTGTTATGLAGGQYTATATDANGCTAVRTVTIAEPAQALSVSITAQQDINCHGQSTGSATVSASGGTGPYGYSWNTVPPRSGASVTGLPVGTWTVTATDVRGCAASQNVMIAAPAAPLAASINTATDVACNGGQTGRATVGVSGGTAPYSYTWNTTPAQHAATATGLGSGTWQVSVLDAHGCGTTASVVIAAPAPLTLDGTVTPAQCQGAANGAVDVTTAGGTLPYTWSWTGPGGFTASTEDLAGMAAGGYAVAVTDANGCTASRSFDINQPGLFHVEATASLFGPANVSCPGSTDGSINLQVDGAVPPYTFTWTGPGGFTSHQKDISGLAAGTYHVGIRDDNGCSTGHDVTLAAPAAITAQLTAANHGGTNLSCNGGSNGSIAADIHGGNAPYTTHWTGPDGFTSASTNLDGLVAGDYQFTITDANGCTATQTAVLTQPLPLVATGGGTSPVTCFGSNTGQATVQVSGGRAPYTYTWNTSPAQHAATAMGLAAGTWTVQVYDANGCSTSASITVGGPQAPLSLGSPTISHVACHGGQDGSATVAASGGTGPYTYAWNTTPVQSGPTATGLAAGTWTVTATDAAGCTAMRNVVITQPAQPLAASVAQTHHVTCFGDNDGSVAINITGGSGHYNVTWNTTPVQHGTAATGLAAGSYIATIADANGCTQLLDFPVGVGGPVEPLDVSAVPHTWPGGAHVSCPESTDGSIQVTVTGGTPSYQYQWQDGTGGAFQMQNPSGLAAGTYHLEVIDGHGCFINTVVTLVPPAALSATATVQSAICHGESNGAVDMTPAGGTAPYSYQWSGPGGFSANGQDLHMIPAGVYTATITDANGCQLAQPFDVTEPGTFTFDATTGNPSCHAATDGSVLLTADGGTPPYEYAWIGPNGFTASTASITGLTGGAYHLTLTDDNGCSALFSTTLARPPALTAFTFSAKHHGGYDVSCSGAANGQVLTVIDGGTPPFSFAWTGPNGFTADTQDINFLEAGTYTVTITDANGCSVTTSTTLAEPPVLSATATATTYAGEVNTSCADVLDGAITLAPTGGTPAYNVHWSGPDSYTSGSWQITGLAAGTYTATITDGNGCTATSTTSLASPAPLVAGITATDIACNGASTGALDLAVSGGSGNYTYAWSGPGAFVGGTQDLSNLPAGLYEVHVTDANGCTATASATVAQAAPIQATAAVTTTECQGANTGAIDLTVTGGTGGHAFLWTGFPAFSATTEDISGLFAGVYTVTITDDAGCTATASYNVGEPDLFQIDAEPGSMAGGYNVSCADAADGSISINVAGGTGPYHYFWNGPGGFTAITPDLAGLAAGEYTLTVHDANGCNAGASFTLVAPQPVQIGIAATAQPDCDGSNDGSIAAIFLGGTAPLTAAWTGPDGPLGIGNNLTGIGAGTYQVMVTDALGCSGTAAITLTGPSAIDAAATAALLPNGSNLSCADASDGSITLAISGGTAPYQVDWNGPNGYHAGQKDIAGLHPGAYAATITDAHGCTAAVQVNLSAPDELALGITTSVHGGGNAVSCAGAADGAITLAVTGGMPGYAVQWSGPDGFSSQQDALDNLAPGTYNVHVTDAAGCGAYASATLNAPPAITTAAVLSDHDGFAVGCNGDDGTIDLSVSGGLPPYQFGWTGPNGFAAGSEDIGGLAAGTYTVEVSDANGCTVNRSFTLTAPENLSLHLAVTSNECDVTSNGEIDLAITGGTAPFGIAWTGPGGSTFHDEDLTGLASGDYAVTVTSSMGCTATAQATVLAAAPIQMEAHVPQYGDVNITCHGANTGLIALTVSGGFAPLDIAWTGPDGYTADTPNINGLAAGLYSATITDSHGCTRDTSITLVQPDSPLATTLDPVDILCHGATEGRIHAVVTGGAAPYTFGWRGPDSTLYDTQDLTGIGAGDYELVVADANQCMNILQATIHQPDSSLHLAFSAEDHNGAHTSCADAADGAIALAATGGTPGYTYAWSGPDGFTASLDSLSGLAAGTYAVLVTDANGCQAQGSFTLNAAPPITVEPGAATIPISCHGAQDGALSGLVDGGTGTLSWEWSGPDGFSSTELDIESLMPGTYCLDVQDANGCTAQACSTITEPDALAAAATATAAPCGLETGTVDATITGGTAPYAFNWSNGAHSEDLSLIPAGTFQLEVADANGCTTSVTATVDGTPGVEATALVHGPPCHASADGSIALEVSTGTAPFIYAWADGSQGSSLEGLPAGEYPVVITDGNGCTWAETVIVAQPEAITVDTVLSHYGNGHNISAWGGHDGSILLHPAGGTPPYGYAWNDGAETAARQGLPAGTYTVAITDANGCTLELSITLTQPDDLAMPTGFTPNGDGQNDAFVVRGIDAWPNNRLTVFNRWGNVVFDQLNYRNDWRGENQQGAALPDGTYFVVLHLGADRTLQHYVDLRR